MDDRAPPSVKAVRTSAQEAYEKLIHWVWHRICYNLHEVAPREWPPLSCLSEDDQQRIWDWHLFAVPLRAVSDYELRLVHRLLYLTRTDMWLSTEDKDWHNPLLIPLRENHKRNWRNPDPEKEKERRQRRKGKGQGP